MFRQKNNVLLASKRSSLLTLSIYTYTLLDSTYYLSGILRTTMNPLDKKSGKLHLCVQSSSNPQYIPTQQALHIRTTHFSGLNFSFPLLLLKQQIVQSWLGTYQNLSMILRKSPIFCLALALVAALIPASAAPNDQGRDKYFPFV